MTDANAWPRSAAAAVEPGSNVHAHACERVCPASRREASACSQAKTAAVSVSMHEHATLQVQLTSPCLAATVQMHCLAMRASSAACAAQQLLESAYLLESVWHSTQRRPCKCKAKTGLTIRFRAHVGVDSMSHYLPHTHIYDPVSWCLARGSLEHHASFAQRTAGTGCHRRSSDEPSKAVVCGGTDPPSAPQHAV